MAWRSDELLDDWKRRTGTPLFIRAGFAGLVWAMTIIMMFRNDPDALQPSVIGFWLIAVASLIYQVFIRGRISFWAQYRHPITWLRFSLWLAWFPTRQDNVYETVVALISFSGLVTTMVWMFVSTP